jgi:hypothetical protein
LQGGYGHRATTADSHGRRAKSTSLVMGRRIVPAQGGVMLHPPNALNASILSASLVGLLIMLGSCESDQGPAKGARKGLEAVTAPASPQTATISPNGDTFLNLDAINYDTATTLNVYTWPDDSIANAIVMTFDLSSIPSGSTISSATLNLYLDSSDATTDLTYTVTANQVIHKNPDVTKATGDTYDGVNGWTPNACCHGGHPLAQADIGPAVDTRTVDKTLGYKQWDVTSVVQAWYTNPSTNYGLLLNSDPSKLKDRFRFFASMESPNVNERPYLTVVYTPPTGATPWIEENFSEYTSQTDLITNPRTSNGVGSWATGGYQYPGYPTPQGGYNNTTNQRIFLDQTVGYGAGGLTQSMRYDWPSMTDRVSGVVTPEFDYTIRLGGLQFPTPIGAGQDVWYEWVVMFPTTFNTNYGANFSGHLADYKFMFCEPLGGSTHRQELKSGTGSGAANITWGTGATFSTDWDVSTIPQDSHGFNTPASVWDGQWHVYRAHAKISTTTTSNDGLWRVWVDGVLYENDSNASYGTLSWQELWAGGNNNIGPAGSAGQVISMWWGRIRVWNSDPGWGG